jgi:hypothetical protein
VRGRKSKDCGMPMEPDHGLPRPIKGDCGPKRELGRIRGAPGGASLGKGARSAWTETFETMDFAGGRRDRSAGFFIRQAPQRRSEERLDRKSDSVACV